VRVRVEFNATAGSDLIGTEVNTGQISNMNFNAKNLRTLTRAFVPSNSLRGTEKLLFPNQIQFSLTTSH
jgi:hypothetical protein